jgi:hypothetical protein
VTTLLHRAPFGPGLAQLSRVLWTTVESLPLPRLPDGPQPDDPVFLQDLATLTPDQAQEMRFGRRRSGGKGRER